MDKQISEFINKKADREWDAFFLLPESDIAQDQGDDFYSGLNMDALQTPYRDYLKILQDLGPGKKLCDLGAGYGRGSFLSLYLNLNNCTSIELSKSRYQASLNSCRSLEYDSDYFICGDISKVDLTDFDAFFCYFPLSRKFLETFRKLLELSQRKPIDLYVIESHGDMLPFLDQLKCLKRLNEWELSIPRHKPQLVKYRFCRSEPQAELLFLQNMVSDYVYEFNFEHQLLNQTATWIIPLNQCSLLYFEESTLEYFPYGRLLKLASVGLPREPQPIEMQLLKTSGKLLKVGSKYYDEKRSGDILAL